MASQSPLLGDHAHNYLLGGLALTSWVAYKNLPPGWPGKTRWLLRPDVASRVKASEPTVLTHAYVRTHSEGTQHTHTHTHTYTRTRAPSHLSITPTTALGPLAHELSNLRPRTGSAPPQIRVFSGQREVQITILWLCAARNEGIQNIHWISVRAVCVCVGYEHDVMGARARVCVCSFV